MKRIFITGMILLLLAGCTAQTQPTGAPETSAPTDAPTETVPDEQFALVGIWRNEGQYSEGRDFIETMSLDPGGICIVELDYMGQDYQTLTGTYLVSNGMLYTELGEGENAVSRNFRYTLSGDELTLETDSKTVVYIRID